MKTKRKDKFKNRFKPKDGPRTRPEYGVWKSIDGTFSGLQFHPEKWHATIGMTCGRCGSTKTIFPGGKIKCINRKRTDLAQRNFWYCEIKGEKFV